MYTVEFSPDKVKILIRFPEKFTLIGYNKDPIHYSEDLCEFLLIKESYDKIGFGPICMVLDEVIYIKVG